MLAFSGDQLKYGFCKKSLPKDATLIWKKREAKSVQLVRVAFFRSDFLQNPLNSTLTLIILPKCRHYKNTYINKSIRLLFFVILPWNTDIEILWFLKSWFSVDFLSDQYCFSFCLFDNFRSQLKYWAFEFLKLFQSFTV